MSSLYHHDNHSIFKETTFLLLIKKKTLLIFLQFLPKLFTLQGNCTHDCSFSHFILINVNSGCCILDNCVLRLPLLLFFQRIAAADLASGLQYFGRSIHGTMDMNNDGLVDLAVGSLGAAVLLWLVCHLIDYSVTLAI